MSIKLIYGVGINDADYQVSDSSTGKEVRCPFYIQWKNILARCYSPAFQRNQPLYKGCTIDDRWLSFLSFKAWMETQDWKGKALDKDILFEGNKHYGPDTCVYVDARTNGFFRSSESKSGHKGVYPNGKGWKAVVTDFVAGKQRYSKTHDDINVAIQAFPTMFHESALQLADMQTDERIAKILRTRFTPIF